MERSSWARLREDWKYEARIQLYGKRGLFKIVGQHLLGCDNLFSSWMDGYGDPFGIGIHFTSSLIRKHDCNFNGFKTKQYNIAEFGFLLDLIYAIRISQRQFHRRTWRLMCSAMHPGLLCTSVYAVHYFVTLVFSTLDGLLAVWYFWKTSL